MHASLFAYVLGRGLYFGLLALTGILVAWHRSDAFRRRGYWIWLVCAFCNALLMPFGYTLMQSFRISYADAVFLRKLYAGSWLVADGYCVFVGVVLGGIVSFIVFGRTRV
jgi:hypothetical protein